MAAQKRWHTPLFAAKCSNAQKQQQNVFSSCFVAAAASGGEKEIINFELSQLPLGETKLPFNHRQKVSNGTLEIVQVEKGADESAYTCVARNARGKTAKSTFYINVIGRFAFWFFFDSLNFPFKI